MGEAAVAVADDAFATYFNPAGLAALSHSALGTSYMRPFGLNFADLLYLGGTLRVNESFGTVGFGVRRFAVDWDGVDPVTGEVTNVDLLEESTYTFGHGFRLYEDLHSAVRVGYALNIYHLEFGPTVSADGVGLEVFENPGSDTVAGLDLGLLVTLHQRTRLGVLVKNANSPQIGLENEEIRQRIHAGIAYEPYLGVVTTFEFENVLGEEIQYMGGLEMAILEGFSLRFGTLVRPNKMTAGFGYEIRGLSVNYGFSSGGGTLDSSHQFGLNFSWGGEAP
jgi:hypothetical protein